MNLVHYVGIARCGRATLFSASILSLRSKPLETTFYQELLLRLLQAARHASRARCFCSATANIQQFRRLKKAAVTSELCPILLISAVHACFPQ
jgi:hypothetical protein